MALKLAEVRAVVKRRARLAIVAFQSALELTGVEGFQVQGASRLGPDKLVEDSELLTCSVHADVPGQGRLAPKSEGGQLYSQGRGQKLKTCTFWGVPQGICAEGGLAAGSKHPETTPKPSAGYVEGNAG